MAVQSNSVTITVTAPSVVTKITLTASSTSEDIDTPDTLIATVYDQNNNPMSGVSVTFVDSTTATTIGSDTTDANGEAQQSVEFTAGGTYTIYAQAG